MFLIFSSLKSIGESIPVVKLLFVSGNTGFRESSQALLTFFPKRLPQCALSPLLSSPALYPCAQGLRGGGLQDMPHRLTGDVNTYASHTASDRLAFSFPS